MRNSLCYIFALSPFNLSLSLSLSPLPDMGTAITDVCSLKSSVISGRQRLDHNWHLVAVIVSGCSLVRALAGGGILIMCHQCLTVFYHIA